MELPSSEAILSHPSDFGPGGSNGAVGAGLGQQVKPRTCKAGGGDGWGGIHEATWPQAKNQLA
jgi:hypothetical protein